MAVHAIRMRLIADSKMAIGMVTEADFAACTWNRMWTFHSQQVILSRDAVLQISLLFYYRQSLAILRRVGLIQVEVFFQAVSRGPPSLYISHRC